MEKANKANLITWLILGILGLMLIVGKKVIKYNGPRVKTTSKK